MLRWFLGIFFVNFLISEGNQSFLKFSSRWQESHESWTNLEWDILRTCQRKYILPVCVDGSSINDPTSCSKAVCYHSEQHCFPTPSDTLDYLPPSSSTAKICEPLSMNHPLPPYYGMEGGIPPEFSNRRSVNLWLFGTIKSTDSCQPLTGVQLQFFHVDNDLYDEDSVVDEGDLRDMSCLGTVDLDDNGGYSFRTTVPPSYGPPRHINLIIKAPGHQILVTRIYFSQDIRLQQLSVGSDVLASHESGFYETSYEFQTEENSRPFLRNILSREPRVCDLKFVADETGGHLEGLHNIFLQPNLPEFSFASLSGYWTEPNGALIRVENIGHYFFASQYPHLRTWGSVSGFIRENSIFGVNFRNSGKAFLSLFVRSPTW